MLGLVSLNKVGEEKDEFRDSNSQLKLRVSDRRAAMGALKESLISRSPQGETAEKQIQNILLRVAEL